MNYSQPPISTAIIKSTSGLTKACLVGSFSQVVNRICLDHSLLTHICHFQWESTLAAKLLQSEILLTICHLLKHYALCSTISVANHSRSSYSYFYRFPSAGLYLPSSLQLTAATISHHLFYAASFHSGKHILSMIVGRMVMH